MFLFSDVLLAIPISKIILLSPKLSPHSSVGKRICWQCRRRRFNSWVEKIPWRRDRLPTPVFLDFPCGSAGKESACNAGDLGSIPELRRSSGEGKGYLLQYSGLEKSIDCIFHAKSWSRLRDFHFTSLKLDPAITLILFQLYFSLN